MDSSHVKAAFIRLKPLCDAFLNSPSKTSLMNLAKEYKVLKPCVLQEVYAFILFPFTVHLRKHHLIKSMELRMAMVCVVNDIFSRTHVDSVEMYFKYFYLMIFQIFDKDSLETTAIDEDFTLNVVKAITTLTVRIPNELRFKLYTRSNATKLGQGIFVCVQLARKVQYRALRLASIHCILAICTLHDDLIHELHTPRFNKQLAECVGDVLMFFLPGLLGAMQDIAHGDQKQGHAITCLAIRTISRVLCLTMMDQNGGISKPAKNDDFVKLVEYHKTKKSEPPVEKPDPFGIKLRAKGVEGMKKHLEKAQRNRDWYDTAGEKLTLLMKRLLPIQYHSHEKVRKEAALMCTDIVNYCPRNMNPSMKYLLEMLIALSEDESPDISSLSKVGLLHFTDNNCKMSRKPLLDVLEENFNTVLTKLPRYLNKLDADLQLCGLHLLKGYLRLMTDPLTSPQRLTQLLTCTHVMNRFAIILVEIFKLECSNIKLLEKCTLRDVETVASDAYFYNIHYTYLQNDACINNALDICKILGASECVELIIDYLLDQYRLDNEYKKEIIFILNEILTAPDARSLKMEHLIRNIINMYIDHENWYLPTNVNKREKPPSRSETYDVSVYNPHEWIKTSTYDLYEGATEVRYTDISYRQSADKEDDDDDDDSESEDDKDNCQTLSQAQNNVIQICLMTEGIGKIAVSMKEEFQPYLLKTLYLILERAGSSIEMIHYAGMRALGDITEAFKLKNITELIKSNADYFTHHVNMKLKKITDNAGVLDVLLVVMRYSEAEVLPCLYNIVGNVLDQRRKTHSHANVVLFLKLFYAFIVYISSKFPAKEAPSPKEDEQQQVRQPTPIDEAERVETPASDDTSADSKFDNVLYSLKEYEKLLNIVDTMDDSATHVNKSTQCECKCQPEEYEDDEESSNGGKPPPSHIIMVVSVIKRTLNFLPSNDRDHKLLAIDIINEGIFFIREYEDEVLPLVHQIWEPLVNRFKETSQPLIVNRAFKLLVTFAYVSKDFIKKRTFEEVMPSLCDFLVKSAKDSSMKDVGAAYRFTQAYKLQLTILEYIGDVCALLNLQERGILDLMNAGHRYLSAKQPKPLQMACMEMFKSLGSHNFGMVWIHLNGLWHNSRANAALEDLKSFNLKEFSCPVIDQSETMEYRFNVCALLDYFKNKNN